MEIWRPIEDTKGRLEVSNYGRVRSFLRDGRILRMQPDKKGYLRLRVTLDGQKRSYKIHRLVAQAFIPNPLHLEQVNHIDGDKSNNSVSNLEWASNIENAHHAISTGLWSGVYEASQKVDNARKTPIVAINAKTGERIRFESVSDAERHFNSRHISDVLNGKRQHVKGYCFERQEVMPDAVQHSMATTTKAACIYAASRG